MHIMALAFALPVLAAGDFARLAAVDGPVSIRPLGHQGFVRAEPGAALIPGDAIRTGPGGVAQLALEGGALLVAAGGSSLVLGEEGEQLVVDFKLGEWLLGPTGRPEDARAVRVVTPQAASSCRGAFYWGKTDPRETQVAVLDRQVEIAARGATVPVARGQSARVSTGREPEPPVAYAVPAAALDRFRVEGNLGGLAVPGPGRPARKPKKK